MPETALHFSEVTFGFSKRKPLFENLSCSLANGSDAGKIIALMGPSGVGKTTFCDLALGIRQPLKGSVKFTPDNANIAVIPQKGVIFDELSIRENITCLKYSKSLGKSFHADKVQHAVELLGLAHVLQSGTHASAISGGEAQRVMLARIQTIHCDVLILDEPCSFLDNRVKDSFLTALRATVDESRLLALMVTHVWDEALQVADEVLFFHQASEKSVSLHRDLVAQAVSCPPTVDALFAIHWPNCAVLNRSEIISLPDVLRVQIPQNVCFIGLFSDRLGHSTCAAWAKDLWNHVASSRTDTASRHRYLRTSSSETVLGSCVFYDEDGVRLRSVEREANQCSDFDARKTN